MRKLPAPLIAAVLGGALSVVVAFALASAHPSSSRAMDATVRLGVVAHAFFEEAASGSSDRIEVAPVGPTKARPSAFAAAAPALPASVVLLEMAAAGVSGSLHEPVAGTPEGRAAARSHRARGPPSRG